MLLNSINFALFFLMVWGIYWALPQRRRSLVLLIASYAFYCFWDYRCLALILISTTVDFWAARNMHSSETERNRRKYLLISIVVNLTILGFFKYFNFFIESAESLLAFFGLNPVRWHLNILLPVGISFYTFKTLSYTIDVYGREMEPTRHWVDYAAFVAFFPQLLSGPIDRAANLLPQIVNPRRLNRTLFWTGAWLLFWGLFKKVVVADNLVALVAPAFEPGAEVSTSCAWTALYAFTLQLYCDFSGYTDMARGVAMLLGFQTAVNFRNPFFASSPIEFWQRWHISLSKWIQDYVYFPLATRALRKSSSFWSQNKTHIYTMTLVGLWHGANMTYIVFGLFWGVLFVLYNLYRTWWKRFLQRLGRKPSRQLPPLWAPRRILAMLVLFHITCFSFVFFRAQSLGNALHYFTMLFNTDGGYWLFNGFNPALLQAWFMIGLLYAPVFIIQIHQEIHNDQLSPLAMTLFPRTLLCIVILIMLTTLAKTDGGTYIYVQF